MAPKAKPAAKGKAKAEAKPSAPPPPQVPKRTALSLTEAEVRISEVTEEEWDELAGLEDPFPEAIIDALCIALLLLGDSVSDRVAAVRAALEEGPKVLLHHLRALGPWGFSTSELEGAVAALEAFDLGVLSPPAAASGGGANAAKALAKAPAKAAAKAKPAGPPPGAVAALAVGVFAEALVATRRDETASFPMSTPTVSYGQLHRWVQQAQLSRQAACLVCPSSAAFVAAKLYCDTLGAAVCDVVTLEVQTSLAKTLSRDSARKQVGSCFRDAMKSGRRCVLLLGDAPPNLFVSYCDDLAQVPPDAFDASKASDAATAIGLSSVVDGFHLVIIVQMSKERAEKVLPKCVPAFEEMAVMVLDPGSLPAPSESEGPKKALGLRAALRLLTLPAATSPAVAPPAAPPAAAGDASSGDDSAIINSQEFEWLESFAEDWRERWSLGPCTTDANGKDIKQNLINTDRIKYPANPKDAKMCMQLVGGTVNQPCTGIWTSFSPLARPTEVEFEFTMNGKVDNSNACVVFTQTAFEGALPDCKVGVQFQVRGGMQLAGGGGSLIKISNDGKILNDKWNKVIMHIDWTEKIVVAQVDTKGKGYAPAIQTVPFRDDTCEGFGFLYIYNTDMQGTCWFTSLRIKQTSDGTPMDTDALDARRELRKAMEKREYDRAVAADMEVGMKMGAIQCTKEHGMNLAQEQAANGSSFM